MLNRLTDTLALHLGLAWTYHGEAKAQEPAEASIVMPEFHLRIAFSVVGGRR